MTTRRLPIALLAVLALAGALVMFRLGQPDWSPARPHPEYAKRYVWDECFYAFTAHRYLLGDPGAWKVDSTLEELRAFDTSDIGPHVGIRTYHAPLPMFVMTAAMWIGGFSAFVTRLPGAICGLVIVACTWLLARRVRGERIATLAAALVALDGVWFTISRVAMAHSYVAAAGACALVAGLAAWQDDVRRARLMMAAGAFCGLGLAFKETAIVPTVLVGSLLLVRTWTRTPAASRGRQLAVWAFAFLALPSLVYLASWIPFFVAWDHTPADFVRAHREILDWHASMPPAMGPSTPWWTWPVLWKPVRLFEDTLLDGSIRQIYARANPFLWWAAVLAIPWAAARFAKGRGIGDLWIVAGYLSTWVLYAFIGRFGFSYYMLPAAPCAAVAVACALDDLCGQNSKARAIAFWSYGALAAGAFAAMYQWLAALPQAR